MVAYAYTITALAALAAAAPTYIAAGSNDNSGIARRTFGFFPGVGGSASGGAHGSAGVGIGSPPPLSLPPMAVVTHIEDLRVLAKQRVPRMFYDDADSGSWTESTYRANENDFQRIKLRQRVAVDGDQLAVRQDRGSRSGTHDGRNSVLPGDDRRV